MTDKELALAIALSLEDANKQREEELSSLFLPIFELVCDKCKKSIFSFDRKEICPICKSDATNIHTYTSPLYTLSSPFSIVVKPTVGTFTRNYKGNSLLHCGITNSKGNVFNFDERGRCIDTPWKNCICIPLATFASAQEWDNHLQTHQSMERLGKSYHQLNNNCYDYVIRFLELIKFENKTGHTKRDIVSRFIETPVSAFESFYNIHEKLEKEPFYAITMNAKSTTTTTRYSCNVCGNGIEDSGHYRCTVCEDYDLCDKCYRAGRVNENHVKSHKVIQMKEF